MWSRGEKLQRVDKPEPSSPGSQKSSVVLKSRIKEQVVVKHKEGNVEQCVNKHRHCCTHFCDFCLDLEAVAGLVGAPVSNQCCVQVRYHFQYMLPLLGQQLIQLYGVRLYKDSVFFYHEEVTFYNVPFYVHNHGRLHPRYNAKTIKSTTS